MSSKRLTPANKGRTKANLRNNAFLNLASQAKRGDVVETDQADLELVEEFDEEGGTYERRVSPTVILRKDYPEGKLFKKHNSNMMLFVPKEQYNANAKN